MIVPITDKNYDTYFNLCPPYEAEFAVHTGDKLSAEGLFEISTILDENNKAFMYYHEGKAVGFIAVNIEKHPFDVNDMFVLKEYRKEGIATKLAEHAFNKYKGNWTVKQIITAKKSRAFWLRMLKEYATNFTEVITNDKVWGEVSMQRFCNL